MYNGYLIGSVINYFIVYIGIFIKVYVVVLDI